MQMQMHLIVDFWEGFLNFSVKHVPRELEPKRRSQEHA